MSPKRRRSSPLTLSAHSALLLREFGIAQHHMHNHDKLSGVVEDLDAILRDRSKVLSPTSPKSPKFPKSPEKKVKKKKRRTSFTTVYELLQHRRRSSTSSSQSNKSDERAAKAMWRWSQTHLKRHQDFKKEQETNERIFMLRAEQDELHVQLHLCLLLRVRMLRMLWRDQDCPLLR